MKLFPSTRLLSLALAAFCVSFAACEDDPKPIDTGTSIAPGEGVFIANEGLFNGGNASVMYYKLGDDAPSTDLFFAANLRPVGDVLQSMTQVGGVLHLLVNNSNRVESVLLPSFVSGNVVNGLANPRQMAVAQNHAFITGYGINGVKRMSLMTNQLEGEITLPGWTDAILYYNNELFVTTPSGSKLYVLNPTAMQAVDSIEVGVGANGLVVDKDGMLWVFCAGESWNGVAGALVKVNPATRQIMNNIDLGLTVGSAGRLCANGALDSLYFLNGDVFRMSIGDNVVPPSFIPAGSRYLYSLYRHPAKPLLFAGDAVDFLQNGEMYIYNADGVLQKQFETGVGPTQVLAY